METADTATDSKTIPHAVFQIRAGGNKDKTEALLLGNSNLNLNQY